MPDVSQDVSLQCQFWQAVSEIGLGHFVEHVNDRDEGVCQGLGFGEAHGQELGVEDGHEVRGAKVDLTVLGRQ